MLTMKGLGAGRGAHSVLGAMVAVFWNDRKDQRLRKARGEEQQNLSYSWETGELSWSG